MAVRCSKCGEELLGAVNRCWKCGQQFSSQPEEGGLPPVRYTPIAIPEAAVVPQDEVVLAELSGSPADAACAAPVEATASPASATAVAPAPTVTIAAPPSGPKPIRTGSPFVTGAPIKPMVSQTPVPAPTRLTGPPMGKPMATPAVHDPVAVAGAVGSIVLGLFALTVAWMTTPVPIIAAFIIAIIGFGMGIWGLYSKRRGWALFGILVCCGALGLATYSGATVIHDAMREHEEQMETDGLGP